MAKFKKFNSIENSYQKEIIQGWVEWNIELNQTRLQITEKIHGANFSLIANPGKAVRFASRNGLLTKEDKFYYNERIFEIKNVGNMGANRSKELKITLNEEV